MRRFDSILKELMADKPIDAKSLALELGFFDSSIIYKWLKDEKGLRLNTAVTLADFFGCSLDYLMGRSEKFGDSTFKPHLPFYTQLRHVLAELKVSQYKLVKDNVVSGGNLNSWLKHKQIPNIDCAIRIADYLGIALDYLVGREE